VWNLAARSGRQVAHKGVPRASRGIPPIIWVYTLAYMGSLPTCGKSFHRCEVFPYIGSLPMYAKSSHLQEVFPHMGRFPIYRESLADNLKFVQWFVLVLQILKIPKSQISKMQRMQRCQCMDNVLRFQCFI
jgi:hypothetical protein